MQEIFSGDSHFPHRLNPDGTFDSICPICFVTVARRDSESALVEFERAHACDPSLISVRRKMVAGDPGTLAARTKAS